MTLDPHQKLISNHTRCELMKLFHINCRDPVFLRRSVYAPRKVYIPCECDKEVGNDVSLVLGERATLGQLVCGVQGLVEQVRRVVGVLKEVRVVGQ